MSSNSNNIVAPILRAQPIRNTPFPQKIATPRLCGKLGGSLVDKMLLKKSALSRRFFVARPNRVWHKCFRSSRHIGSAGITIVSALTRALRSGEARHPVRRCHVELGQRRGECSLGSSDPGGRSGKNSARAPATLLPRSGVGCTQGPREISPQVSLHRGQIASRLLTPAAFAGSSKRQEA